MYFGPLDKWPRPWMWVATAGLAVVVVVLAALNVNALFFLIPVLIAILIVAAPRRVDDLGGPGALGSDEDRER